MLYQNGLYYTKELSLSNLLVVIVVVVVVVGVVVVAVVAVLVVVVLVVMVVVVVLVVVVVVLVVVFHMSRKLILNCCIFVLVARCNIKIVYLSLMFIWFENSIYHISICCFQT